MEKSKKHFLSESNAFESEDQFMRENQLGRQEEANRKTSQTRQKSNNGAQSLDPKDYDLMEETNPIAPTSGNRDDINEEDNLNLIPIKEKIKRQRSKKRGMDRLGCSKRGGKRKKKKNNKNMSQDKILNILVENNQLKEMNDKLFNTCGELGLIIKDLKSSITTKKKKKKSVLKKERKKRKRQECVNRRLKEKIQRLEGVVKNKIKTGVSSSDKLSSNVSLGSQKSIAMSLLSSMDFRYSSLSPLKNKLFKKKKKTKKVVKAKKKPIDPLIEPTLIQNPDMIEFEQKVYERENFHRFVPKDFSKKTAREEIKALNEIDQCVKRARGRAKAGMVKNQRAYSKKLEMKEKSRNPAGFQAYPTSRLNTITTPKHNRPGEWAFDWILSKTGSYGISTRNYYNHYS